MYNYFSTNYIPYIKHKMFLITTYQAQGIHMKKTIWKINKRATGDMSY
jgi:hypothetical protein